jgi:hypothetical protein
MADWKGLIASAGVGTNARYQQTRLTAGVDAGRIVALCYDAETHPLDCRTGVVSVNFCIIE